VDLPVLSCAAESKSARLFTATERETDAHRVEKRKKQINFGYNTAGYQSYVASVPKCVHFKPSKAAAASCISLKNRDRRSQNDPVTPDASWKWSTRGWGAAVAGTQSLRQYIQSSVTPPRDYYNLSATAWRVLLHKFDPPPETGVIDISGSLKRIVIARMEDAPVPWTQEHVKFKAELAASRQACGSQAPVHSTYAKVRAAGVSQTDAQLLQLPLDGKAAASAVASAIRQSVKRGRQGEQDDTPRSSSAKTARKG
jgi:hypothetical protein